MGVTVEISKLDVSDKLEAKQLIGSTQKKALLGGIFHLAAVRLHEAKGLQ